MVEPEYRPYWGHTDSELRERYEIELRGFKLAVPRAREICHEIMREIILREQRREREQGA